MSNAKERLPDLAPGATEALVARDEASVTAGLGLERIVGALLSRGLDELAAAGREALLPVLPPPLLLSTEAVVRMAESHAGQAAEPQPGTR